MAQVESPVPWVIGPTNHATTAECTNFASVVHNPLSHSPFSAVILRQCSLHYFASRGEGFECPTPDGKALTRFTTALIPVSRQVTQT